MIIPKIKSLTKNDYQHFLDNGISYSAYQNNMKEDLRTNQDSKIREYIYLNQVRMSRVEKTYIVNNKVRQAVSQLHHKMSWLLISEHWCGDAAQNLPALSKIAQLSNGMIELKIVYRDQNEELMETHLTNGSRSIPKLIQLDSHLNITGIWGPRPSPAQALVNKLKSNPETASTYSSELHKWYAHDKNKSLENEALLLINKSNLFCQDCFN